MTKATRKQNIVRGTLYVIGVMVLALGLSFNTKSGLGVTPVISLAFSSSRALGINYSYCVFVMYCLLLLISFIIRGKKYRKWSDLLQLPFSFFFSAMLDIYDRYLPIHFDALWQNLLLTAAAIILVGTGMFLVMNMRIVVNPADGVVQSLAVVLKKDQGLMKNLEDAICVSIAMVIDLCFNTLWTSIGLGTVLSMIFVGRVIHLHNRLFLKKMLKAAGLKEINKESV